MRRRLLAPFAVTAIALSGASATVAAVEPVVMSAPAIGAKSELGYSSAVDGGWVALGAPGYVGSIGAALVYDCTAVPCAPPVQIASPAAIAGARFGYAVAISGDTLVVGAPNDGPGRAFVFLRNGAAWTLQAQLAAFDGTSGDRFGTSVTIDGDKLAVGADRYNGQRGAVYLFQRASGSWTQVTRVTAFSSAAGDRFGSAVALSGNRLAVGAPSHDPSATPAGYARGAVYVYTISGATATQDARLVASDSNDAAQFGYAVSLDGARLAAGAPSNDASRGVVYAFARGPSTWTQTARLPWLGAGNDAQFGRAVALSGDRLIAGAPFSGTQQGACGLAQMYKFNGSTWVADPLALPVLPAAAERGGWSVALDGHRWLLGSPGLARSGMNSGGAHWFDANDALFGDGFEDAGTACGTSPPATSRRAAAGG